MSFILKPARVCVCRMAAAARASNTERPELGYESMSHFVIDTDVLAVMLTNIDFCSGTLSVHQHKSKESDCEREGDEEVGGGRRTCL